MFFVLPFPAGLIVAAFVLFGIYACSHPKLAMRRLPQRIWRASDDRPARILR